MTSAPCRGQAGILEVRRVTSRVYGIRVQPRLISRLQKVRGLTQANPQSNLFCLEVGAMDNSPETALRLFKEIVTRAKLGSLFKTPSPS